jgi:Putative peptidoglycan binding domain
MPVHTVSKGECILSIADQNGLFWKTVWEHSQNSELRQKRADPNVLQEGDQLFVPDKTLGEESCATEQHHKFKRKGVPGKLRVRLLVDDQPIANAPYTLFIDGDQRSGSTDGDGFVEESIPPGAQQGELRVTKDGHKRTFYLQLGHLNPNDTEEGVRQRLTQMGYHAGDDLPAAVRGFQQDHGLTVNGTIDDALRNKLEEVYGQ